MFSCYLFPFILLFSMSSMFELHVVVAAVIMSNILELLMEIMPNYPTRALCMLTVWKCVRHYRAGPFSRGSYWGSAGNARHVGYAAVLTQPVPPPPPPPALVAVLPNCLPRRHILVSVGDPVMSLVLQRPM
jgi:hypothetical protein